MSFFSSLGRWWQRPSSRPYQHQRTRLEFENLEERSLLAATPFVNFSGFTPDTGVSSTDNLTKDSAITLNGTGTPGTSFILYANTSLITRSTVLADGTWSIRYPNPLGSATYTFKVVPSTNNDPIASGILPITFDKIRPTVTITPQKFVAGHVPQVLVKGTDAQGTDTVAIDIDLNGNRKIEAEEMGLVQSTIVSGQSTLLNLTAFPSLPTVYLRARVTDRAGNETATALVSMKGPQPNKVTLTVPTSTSAVTYQASVQVTPGLNNGYLPGVSVDVDLNRNGTFEANEAYATGTLDSFGRTTLTMSGLVPGGFRVRARITDLYNTTVVSATQIMTIKDAVSPNLSPIVFEPNAGQVIVAPGQADPGVQFIARLKNGPAAYLSPAMLTLQAPVHDTQGNVGLMAQRMVLVGGNTSAQGVGQALLSSDSSYYVHGMTLENLRNYGQVLFSDVYTNVDVRYRGGNGLFAYDFLVNPGGNPEDIVLDFPDAASVSLDAQGQLVVALPDGQTIVHGLPITYQLAGSVEQVVPAHFVIDNGQVSIQVGSYDLARTLYIDPYVFTNFLTSNAPDTFEGMTQDSQGNLFVIGTTAGANYPEIPAPAVTNNQAGTDVIVTKLDSAGRIIWSVYIGGDRADSGGGIAVDSASNVYITGQTGSVFGGAGDIPFPISLGTPAPTSIIPEAFVTMLNPNGTINQSTLLSGGIGAEAGTRILLDGNENIYVLGTGDASGFPTPYSGDILPGANTFMTKFARRDLFPTTGYQWSTGLLNAQINQVAIDALDRIYISGNVGGGSIGVTANAYRSTQPTPSSGYFIRILGDGTATNPPTVDYSTYIGGTITNLVPPSNTTTGLAVDTSFDVYLTGTTNTNNFFQPALTVGMQVQRLANQSDNDAYVIKLHIDTATTTATAGTYFGNRFRNDQGFSVGVDSRKNIYLYGTVSKLGVDTVAPAIYNKNPVQTYLPGGDNDAFVAILTPNAATQLLGTTVGGSGTEAISPHGFIVDPAGTMYIAGETSNTASFQTQIINGKGSSTILGNSGTAAPIDIYVGRLTRTQTQTLFQDPFEPNDTSELAKGIDRYINGFPLPNLTTARHANGLFDFDWYKLRAPSSGTLTVTLTNISVFASGPKGTFGNGGDLNLFIYRRVNGFLYLADRSILSKSGFQKVKINVNAGEEFVIQVNPVNFTQALYTMRVSLT